MKKFLSVFMIFFFSILSTSLFAQSNHEAYGDSLFVRTNKNRMNTAKLVADTLNNVKGDHIIYVNVPKKLNIKDKIFLVNHSQTSILQAVVVLMTGDSYTTVGSASFVTPGSRFEMASYDDNGLKRLKGHTIGIKIKGVKKAIADISSTGIAGGGFATFKDTLHMQEAHSVMSMNPDVYEECGFCSSREEQFLYDNQGIINYPYVIISSSAKGTIVNNCVISNEMCYVDEHGVIYDWKKKKLLFFHPALRIEYYTIIDGCEEIKEGSFPSFGYFDPRTQGGESISNRIKYITLPASLHRISGNPFKECVSLMSIYVPNGEVESFKGILPQELHSKIRTFCKD